MGIYKKILVAYDASESSKNALKQALVLGKAEGAAEVHVMYVMPSSAEMGVDLLGQSALMEPAKKMVEEAKAIAREAGSTVTTSMEQGTIIDRIIAKSVAGGFDLIVMGRRGRSRIERMLMGSVTSRVIGLASKDVLVVPATAALGVKKVMVSTDCSEYSLPAVARAISFAKAYGAELTAVSVVDIDVESLADAPTLTSALEDRAKSALDEIEAKAKAAGVKVKTSVKEGPAHKELVRMAGETKAEILFMGTHGRKGISRFFMGSVTEKVIGLSPCAVLVARN